jgi:hypothetical protein
LRESEERKERNSREKRELVGLCWETEKNGFYYFVSKLKTLDDGPPRHQHHNHNKARRLDNVPKL